MLLCNDMTGERARVAQSPPPWRPGLPAVNRRFAVPSAYSFRLIGYGRRQRPCKARPLGASMRLAPAYRKRLSDLQPDQGVAVSYSFLIRNVHRFRKKITGDPSALWERSGDEGIRPQYSPIARWRFAYRAYKNRSAARHSDRTTLQPIEPVVIPHPINFICLFQYLRTHKPGFLQHAH